MIFSLLCADLGLLLFPMNVTSLLIMVRRFDDNQRLDTSYPSFLHFCSVHNAYIKLPILLSCNCQIYCILFLLYLAVNPGFSYPIFSPFNYLLYLAVNPGFSYPIFSPFNCLLYLAVNPGFSYPIFSPFNCLLYLAVNPGFSYPIFSLFNCLLYLAVLIPDSLTLYSLHLAAFCLKSLVPFFSNKLACSSFSHL